MLLAGLYTLHFTSILSQLTGVVTCTGNTSMSSYVIDYFVSVGVPSGQALECTEHSYEELYYTAITDIAIMMPGIDFVLS